MKIIISSRLINVPVISFRAIKPEMFRSVKLLNNTLLKSTTNPEPYSWVWYTAWIDLPAV